MKQKKKCCTCHKTRILSKFCKNKNKSDGLQKYCKECASNAFKKYYALHKEEFKDQRKNDPLKYNPKYYANNKERFAESHRKFKAEHPDYYKNYFRNLRKKQKENEHRG